MHSASLESSVGQGMGQDWVLRQPGHGYSQMWCSFIPIPVCAHPAESCAQVLWWREAALRNKEAWRELAGTGRRRGLFWGSLYSSCLFSEATTPRPLTRVCSPPGRKMVTTATVATKSVSTWEVQQFGTSILRVEPWQQDYARVFILLLLLTHHASGSFPAHLGHWCCCISLQWCSWCTKAAPLGRSLWHSTLLS